MQDPLGALEGFVFFVGVIYHFLELLSFGLEVIA
jgi:hypothetical protein